MRIAFKNLPLVQEARIFDNLLATYWSSLTL